MVTEIFECPTCGKNDFKSEGGMKNHHYYVHDESLVPEKKADVPCPTCGEGYGSERAVKVHHKKAHGESISDYKCICETCGEEFVDYSHNYGKYCSRKCYGLAERDRIERQCEYCGERIERKRSQMLSRYVFCSRDHVARYREEYDDFHPWEGAEISKRGKNWKIQREKTLQRDGFECQDCGSDELLVVHHKIPFREFEVEEYEEANRLENLITLCRSCHIRIETEGRSC